MFLSSRLDTRRKTQLLALLLVTVPGLSAWGQSAPSRASARSTSKPARNPDRDQAASRSIQLVVEALRANPLIAPYPIQISWQKDRITLSGRVGSRAVYDLAIRTMIDIGVPFREALVIDTAEAYREAQAVGVDGAIVGIYPTQLASTMPYVYPPPLFGRIDEPFYGFEPPSVSFPSPSPGRQLNQDPNRAVGVNAGPQGRISAPGRSASPATRVADAPVRGNAQISIDEFGRVLLRGVVADEQTKAIIEQEAASVPGISQVINELTVEVAPGGSDSPPFTPRPIERAADEGGNGPEAIPPPPQPHPPADFARLTRRVLPDNRPKPQSLGEMVSEAVSKRSPESKDSVKVIANGDVVTLSGSLPSAYEAMLAFRAAQQTPGVREVIDHLEFPIPDEDSINPLLRSGRPEDLQPYLAQQIRRNLGDDARVANVVVDSHRLEVHGTLARADDQKRVAAILRSMPILRGFQIEPKFRTN